MHDDYQWPVSEIPLWDTRFLKEELQRDMPPLPEEQVVDRSSDLKIHDRFISNVLRPSIFPMIPENPLPLGILIIPGGGYERVVIDKEGFEIGAWLNSHRISAFILKYRLPCERYEQPHVVPFLDAHRAMLLLRKHAKAWGNLTTIGIMGFSAGAHIAAELCTHWDTPMPSEQRDSIDIPNIRPDVGILIYPVISMKIEITHPGSRRRLLGPNPSPALVDQHSIELQIRENMPPLFVVHALDDKAVPVTNSLLLCEACSKKGVALEAHIFPEGGHGFGLRTKHGPISAWPHLLLRWLNIE
ncbi:alpha/beta hydrolase [Gracilinema caldarium]|uniref:Dienelactone hydrolase n=1 Tax=Gracilinema caldarium (strain ATCC 51460 / DSM 7334 / H1) TaxID=744872 RepID=F8F4B8_GRAC1|nr:alpha/beta hydrolase [Gracilinema caldarium]AEJ20565.1 dienelactone hydrolase [Gracilinema caldarium DSM 7334]